MENDIKLEKIDNFNFFIKTNYQKNKFNIFSFTPELLENMYYAIIISLDNQLYDNPEILEIDEKLYFRDFNSIDEKRIIINNNELILYPITEHENFAELLNKINLLEKICNE